MSDQVCCSTSLIRFPLPSPANLAAVAGDDQLALTWDAVTGAVSYVVSWYGGGNTGSATVTTNSYTITGLEAGTEYTVSVTAIPGPLSNNDASWPSTITESTTGAPLATPANLAVVGSPTATAAAINWDAVTNADGYTVTLSPNDGSVVVDQANSSAAFTGLTAATQYTASVVATDSTNAHPDSTAATVQFTTAAS